MDRTRRNMRVMIALWIATTSALAPKVAVVGASGYIGKYVVAECVRRNLTTTAVVRTPTEFPGATTIAAEATDLKAMQRILPGHDVICCLASRSGSQADSSLVDFEASVNCATACDGRFVLLSAFCVQKPDLAFQRAKLLTEEFVQGLGSWCIVRPTAFFKSLSGQVEIVKSGGPFVYFDLGGGRSATCNPISEQDLASALVDSLASENRIWNIGGPGPGVSMKDQGLLIADAIAEVENTPRKDPWLLPVPIGLFDFIVGTLDKLADFFDSDDLRDTAEFGRIGRYYAVEDMLTTAPEEKYGNMTLYDHYKSVLINGQQYDPYTTVFGSKK